jgi:hypothetical protein
VWREERLWGGLYRWLGLYREGNKPSTTIAMIPRGSGRYMRGLRASGAMGGAVAPWVLLHPRSSSWPRILSRCVFMHGDLDMLVSDFYSLGSVSDSSRCSWSWWIKRTFMLQKSHDLVIKSGLSCDQHVSSKIEQESASIMVCLVRV